MLQTPAVVFCDVDSLVPVRGKMAPGFDEFSAALQLFAHRLIRIIADPNDIKDNISIFDQANLA